MKRSVKALLVLGIVVLWSPMVFGWTFQWGPVDKYTDNTVITRPITYNTWLDNVPFGTGLTGTLIPIPSPGSGVNHLLEVAAVVDNVSSARAGLSWTSPLSQPGIPGGLQVVP